MAKSGIILKGQKQLVKNLNEFHGKFFKQVIKGANADLMKPVSQDAKAIVRAAGGNGPGKIDPKLAKATAKSIGRRTKVYAAQGNVVTVVGPRFGATVESEDGSPRGINYLQIEFGHDPGGKGKEILPVAMIRKAWDKNVSSIQSKYAKALSVGMTKVAARMKK